MKRHTALLLLLVMATLGVFDSGAARAGESEEDPLGELTRDAAPDADEARRLFQRGQSMYRSRRYDEAAAAFARAYQLGGPATLLFNLAQAHRLAGACAAARRAYARYLKEVPAASNRAVAERHYRNLERCVGPQASPSNLLATEPATSPAPSPPAPPPAVEPAPPLHVPITSSSSPVSSSPVSSSPVSSSPVSSSPLSTSPPSTSPLPSSVMLSKAPQGRPSGELPPERPTPTRPRRSMAMRNLGLITIGLGASALVAGVVLDDSNDSNGIDSDDDDDDGGGVSWTGPLKIGGGVATGLGIVFAIWGQARGSSSTTALLPVRGGGMVARAWQF